jgi:hypothetical protein
MHPVVASAIPGACGVIAAPIVTDAEGHDANTQTRTELNDRNAPALVVVIQIVTVDPAAVAFPIDVTPSPIVDTTVEI